MAARAAYTLGHDPTSVDDLAAHPDFAAVGRARMRQWADEEDWDSQRRDACSVWRQRAEGSLGAVFLRRQAKQMQLLAHLHDEAVRMRCQQNVQPRSWESVANVQLKAADLMRQWSRDHVQALAKLGTPAEKGEAADKSAGIAFSEIDDMSDEEALVGAHAVLRGKLTRRNGNQAEDEMAENKASEPIQLRRAAGGT